MWRSKMEYTTNRQEKGEGSWEKDMEWTLIMAEDDDDDYDWFYWMDGMGE